MPMPLILPSFAAGEISPALHGRVDLAKYQVGLATCLNWFIHPFGGASTRAGTAFVGEVVEPTVRSRLIPFQFNTAETYVLEFADRKMRVIKGGSGGTAEDGGYVLEAAMALSGISRTNPGIVTTAVPHGLVNGDHVWIEGTIPSKVTVVAANVVNAGIAPNIYLKNNILYEETDGSDGLTAIAEHNVLITPDSPTTMTLNGIFIAQGGAFGRNYYGSPYDPKTGTLTILGTTVSNKRTGTKWCLNQSCTSYGGYQNRVDSYDRRIASDPPAFTPVVSTDYKFVEWREE